MIRKTIIVVLTLAAFGAAGVWLASCTIVGQGFEQYEGVHGVSQTFRYGGGSVGWGASDATGRSALSLILCTRLDSSDVVQEGLVDFAGFGWSRLVMPYQGGRVLNRSLLMPAWAPVVLFAAYPTIAFIRGPLRRWRRRRTGRCIRCGYDLTGNASGRCPECGQPA